MSELEEKILEYRNQKNYLALQKYVESIDENKICKYIEENYTHPNFANFFSFLLKAFTEARESHQKRFNIVSTLLHLLESDEGFATKSNSMLTPLCIELPKFKIQHLIDIGNFCLERIQKGHTGAMCWKEILPELLNLLKGCRCVHYNQTQMTGLEYKTQFISNLCAIVWSPKIIISLTTMFIEMPLNKEEHLQVIKKLGPYMEKLPCQEIPVFVYQLLKLCRYQNGRYMFLRIQHYFDATIYCKLNMWLQSSSAFDIIMQTSEQEIIDIESTVLFHIYQSAANGNECIKDYLSFMRNVTKCPRTIIHPFQLILLLYISTISAYERKIMDLLKDTIAKSIKENLRKQEAGWVRDLITTEDKIKEVIGQIIDNNLTDRYMVYQGVVQLAYTLLTVSPMLGRDGDLVCEKQWSIGKMILVKVIRKRRNTASSIITALKDRIVTNHNVYEYIDCIHKLSADMNLIMMENRNCVFQLLELLVQVPGPVANQLFIAILPMIKLSISIRDQLILLLRKALFSRTTDTREMAVTGFLKLIKHFNVASLSIFSQSSSFNSNCSSYSVLTQASLNCETRETVNQNTNEALCLEILSILRRCFMQQFKVRSQLYEGLNDAVHLNPELSVPVLDMLWIHFTTLYEFDENTLPPLKFEKITCAKGGDLMLSEPIGKLINAMGLIAIEGQRRKSEHKTVVKIIKVLESLCTRMINSKLSHFKLDQKLDLTDTKQESQHKLFVLKEAASVYEALIGYKIHSWTSSSQTISQTINDLFQGYFELKEFVQKLPKKKRTNKKRKADDSDEIEQTQSSAKSTAKGFQFSDTVFDFPTLMKIFDLLYQPEVDWATTTELKPIKAQTRVFQHITQAVMQLVQKIKNLKSLQHKYTKVHFSYMSEVASILYHYCILQLKDIIKFDCATAVLNLECFHLILVVITTHYHNQFAAFLSQAASKGRVEDIQIILKEFIDAFKTVFELQECSLTIDKEHIKLRPLIINILAILINSIPLASKDLSKETSLWLKHYVYEKSVANKQVASSFVTLALTMDNKFKNCTSLLEMVAYTLNDVVGAINEEKSDTDNLKIIDLSNAVAIFALLCKHIKADLDDLDWIVARLRAEYTSITYLVDDVEEKRTNLKTKEVEVSCRLCLLMPIITVMCNISVPPGHSAETLFKNLAHLYNLLTSLTKYYILRSTKINLEFQSGHFEDVVKAGGKRLSRVIYDYIMYIEELNNQEIKTTQSKKKSVDPKILKNIILRDTKLIPKVIFEIEQFGASVIRLTNKTKVDLTKYIGQGCVRDFRIKGLKEILNQMRQETFIEDDEDSISDTTKESDGENVGEVEVVKVKKAQKKKSKK